MICIIQQNGYMDLQDKANGKVVLRVYKSPLATRLENMWMGRALRWVYRMYYLKVSMDNCLDFYDEAKRRK